MPRRPESDPRRERGSQPRIPEWVRRERISDMAWIGENIHIFWPAAQEQYQERGRGAIVVDTMEQPVEGAGNPFTYLIEEELKKLGDDDALRMVRAYKPEAEIVILLLKGDRSSVYRMMVL